jgi:hypothetical protein
MVKNTKNGRIAVKVSNHLGDEVMKVITFVESYDAPVWNVAAIKKRHEKTRRVAEPLWNLSHI